MRAPSRSVTTAIAVAPLLIVASVATATPSTAAAGNPGKHTNSSRRTPRIAPAVRHQIAKHGSAEVVMALRGDAATAHPDTERGQRAHAKAVGESQAPVLSLLAGSGRASDVHAYHAFNVISARVTRAGLAKLATSDDVAVIAPNATIKMSPDAAPEAVTAPKPPTPVVGPAVTPPGRVCSSTKPQLNPEALQTTHTQSDDPNAKTARSLGATGSGVTVAFMAEGIDVNNPDFIRPDGSPVFTDYQDFSGDGTTAPTAAGEAYLDASSIAAQGRETYDVSHFSNLPDKGACKIRIEGVAPGANLVALKVFGENELAFTSGFLQAIDYAVNTDHVDVLSQSFGSNPVPDSTMDVIRQADEAAVAAGTTVTVSSGDAGVTNTIGSPATSPGVIAAGATTTYRFDLQTGYAGSRFPEVRNYLSDNISSLSSSGTDQSGSTVDLVAPGELNWGLCTPDLQQYQECASYAGAPSDVAAAGGTSESAPLVAGGAALVIQAYRQTHRNMSPTPAQVKQLLTSTARDVDAPGDQQGAGELDTYRAVLAARSITGSSTSPAPQGGTFVTDTPQIDVTADPGSSVSRTITVTNTGASAQTVTPTTRALGAYSVFHQQRFALSKHSPTRIDFQGYRTPYKRLTFKVPAGASRLDASIAYQAASGELASRARMTLIGPHGYLDGYSLPQGIGNYGDSQVANPTPGTWTAYVYTRPAAAGGSLGNYVFGWRTARFATSGTVSAPLTLQPGQSGTVSFTTSTPASPGDKASSIVLDSNGGQVTTIPVILRSLVPLSTDGTPFRGTLTGGNGRDANTGQGEYYSFDVAANTPQLNAQVSLASNPDNPFFVSLIAPSGDQVGYASNEFLSSLSAKASPTPNLSAVAHVLEPQAGRWTIFVNFAPVVSGTALSQGFSVLVNTAGPSIVQTGLPNDTGTSLPADRPYVAYVQVTNRTKAPEAFFADARTGQSTTVTLAGTDNDKITLPETETEPSWLVPSRTTSITANLTTGKPAEFDISTALGDPDIESTGSGTSTTATYTAPTVTPGGWFLGPQQVGPYGSTPTPHTTGSATLTATTDGFDRSITTSTGDLWLQSVYDNAHAVAPLVLQPGKSGVIAVRITPTAATGSTVSGTLYIDTLASFTPFGISPNANEVAALPYKYTVG